MRGKIGPIIRGVLVIVLALVATASIMGTLISCAMLFAYWDMSQAWEEFLP